MRHSKAITMVFCLLCGCLLFSAQLSGQPAPPAPTHGTITITYISGRAFTWSTVGCSTTGCGWNLTGTFDWVPGWRALCYPCVGPIDVYGGANGSDLKNGTANFVGTANTYYGSVDWGNFFSPGPAYFEVTGPPIPYAPPAIGTFSGPFSFAGGMCGVIYNHQYVCDVYIPNMTGTGVVFVTIAKNDVGIYYATKVEYVF